MSLISPSYFFEKELYFLHVPVHLHIILYLYRVRQKGILLQYRKPKKCKNIARQVVKSLWLHKPFIEIRQIIKEKIREKEFT